ncbi:MAG TPA: baseplate J/gp47 family protein [Rhodanobacter sp.]|nr:baseplate J/gp47 family protein [Rhodanobacter sp.]
MAGSFASIDLSQLPMPDVVEQIDFEKLFAAALADLIARYPEFSALVESDSAYKVLEVCTFREVLVRQRCNEAARAVLLAYAEKADLDNLGAVFGVVRLMLDPGNPAEGIPPTMEGDPDFRYRITLAPEGYSVAGPEGAYIYHTRSADPAVLDASATSPSPGEVVVTVLSRVGDGTASAALLATVAAAVNAENVRPLTDHVTVQSASIVDYQVVGTRYTYAGPDSAVVLAASDASLQNYITTCHKLGLDVTFSGLCGAIMVQGMQRVDLTAPAANIVIDRTHASFCNGINLTYGGVAE